MFARFIKGSAMSLYYDRFQKPGALFNGFCQWLRLGKIVLPDFCDAFYPRFSLIEKPPLPRNKDGWSRTARGKVGSVQRSSLFRGRGGVVF